VNHEDADAIFHRRMGRLQDIDKSLAKVGVADVGLNLIIGGQAIGNGASQQERQFETEHPVSLSSDAIMNPVNHGRKAIEQRSSLGSRASEFAPFDGGR
jgi:hypothetical protein